MSAIEMVQTQYPYLAWLINDPEIGPLLSQAVDPFTGFDANTFQAKLMATNWFRSRSREAREREVQFHTDPNQYWAEADAYADQLRVVAAKFGRPISDPESYWLTVVGLNQGIAPDSPSMMEHLRAILRPDDVLFGSGTAGAAKQEVENLLHGQWLNVIPMSKGELAHLAGNIAQGLDSLESVNARLASHASHFYPHLREQIAGGQTLADIFNPYRQIIADELEMGSVEQVDMKDARWQKLMQWPVHQGEQTSDFRLPTASEVRTLARDRPQWWQTSAGKQFDAAGVQGMLRLFGQRA